MGRYTTGVALLPGSTTLPARQHGDSSRPRQWWQGGPLGSTAGSAEACIKYRHCSLNLTTCTILRGALSQGASDKWRGGTDAPLRGQKYQRILFQLGLADQSTYKGIVRFPDSHGRKGCHGKGPGRRHNEIIVVIKRWQELSFEEHEAKSARGPAESSGSLLKTQSWRSGTYIGVELSNILGLLLIDTLLQYLLLVVCH
jgi:hypothetical protein